MGRSSNPTLSRRDEQQFPSSSARPSPDCDVASTRGSAPVAARVRLRPP
jgi:hypothetical protein